ncbi:hypothetical protein BLX24_13560 [Arsenicibacter rosenii]|uniref:Uncharacterized protein n=1 Tax=Arsenicibacter rosenii TaxID=1750698 RepID=A0A1S2VIM1_9BACT|nr:hypothetical protein BLX24_13560 [Arsenicibacter rosenii]
MFARQNNGKLERWFDFGRYQKKGGHMTRIITIETQNDQDFDLVKGLAERMGLHTQVGLSAIDEIDQKAAFEKFVGSWQGEETGDELVDMIYSARNDKGRDIEL